MSNSLRTQVEHVEYFILKVKSIYARLTIGGLTEQHQTDCEQSMKIIERRICSQLLLISNAFMHLANTCLPMGQCMDAVVKLLIQHYVCLANITKHFIVRHKTLSVSLNHSKFDQLVKKIGKALPLHIYRLITHIEGSIFEEEGGAEAPKKTKYKNPKADKAKVMRDTKYIPKLILRIENFNKFVNCLSKKTKHDLSKLLHVGTVQDFRIKTTELRQMIDKTFHDSEQIEVDESELENEKLMSDDDDNESYDDDEDSSDMRSTSNAAEATDAEDDGNGNNSKSATTSVTSGTPTPTNDNIVEDATDDESTATTENALTHLAAINKRVTRRRKRTDDADDTSEARPAVKRTLRKR